MSDDGDRTPGAKAAPAPDAAPAGDTSVASILRDDREAHETLEAIGSDQIDAYVVTTRHGPRVVLSDRGVEAPYRLMVDSMGEGAVTLGPDGTLLYLNRRLGEMLEQPVASLMGTKLLDLVEAAPDDLRRLLAEAPAVLRWRGEITMRASGDVHVPVLLSIATLPLEDDAIVRVALCTDLRDQRHLQALAEAGELAERILDQASEAVVVCDPLGTVTRANRAALRLRGGSDPMGLGFGDAFPLEVEVGRLDLAMLRPGITLRARARLRGSAGSHPCMVSASALVGADGRSFGSVVTLADLTDLHAATARLRRHARQARCTTDLSRAALAGATMAELTSRAATELAALLPGHRIVLRNGSGGAPTDRHDGVRIRSVTAAGAVVAELVVEPDEQELAVDDAAFLDTLVSLLSLAADQRLLHDQLHHQATHDALTGLPNRALLEERLQQATKRAALDGKAVAVLFIDLDRFKDVNDSLGHQAGNAVLVQVAQRLMRHVPASDTVARVGGDEFVVVVTGLARADDALDLADAITDELAEPFAIGARRVRVRATVGIAVFPRDGRTSSTLLTKSDRAMYHGKRRGRNLVHVFRDDMSEPSAVRLDMEHDLPIALAAGALDLHFQPQVAVASGALQGFEALARWRHPRHGWISPSRFVGVAEDMGIVTELGAWAIREACRLVAPLVGTEGGPDRVSVNVSPMQLERPGFVALVRSALSESGLDASHLELEVTERIVMHDIRTVTDVLAELRALGVRIALDDFGLGYSSVSYLGQLPLDRLKVDRSFVSNGPERKDREQQRSILAAIVTMGQALGLEVTVEGIETPRQLKLARDVGSDEAQGYLFGDAVPPEGLGEVIDRFRSGVSTPPGD
jgi:diguanylate cyclase (GGDEF)-like protein